MHDDQIAQVVDVPVDDTYEYFRTQQLSTIEKYQSQSESAGSLSG